MAYRFQPNLSRPFAPAVPVQSLLAQVLGITALGLGITALAVYLFPNVPSGVGLIAMLIGFVVLISINATRANGTLSLALFYAFAFLEGIGIAPVVTYYAHVAGPGVVFNAALTTGLGMFALGAVVYATGLDLRRFQGFVMLALIGVIIVSVVSIFVHFIQPTTISWLVLVIFSALVLIDFARIRAGGDGLTPVQMAVSIYLDAINIFLALLRILGNRRSD